MESIRITKWTRREDWMEQVYIYDRNVHIATNNTTGCISVHALIDQGQDVCVCVRTCM